MQKKQIHTDKAGKAVGPYSQAIEYNGIVYVSGVVLGYKCGHKNVESVKLKARKDVSNIEQAVYRRIQNDGG